MDSAVFNAGLPDTLIQWRLPARNRNQGRVFAYGNSRSPLNYPEFFFFNFANGLFQSPAALVHCLDEMGRCGLRFRNQSFELGHSLPVYRSSRSSRSRGRGGVLFPQIPADYGQQEDHGNKENYVAYQLKG
jgi:hypothetical protein